MLRPVHLLIALTALGLAGCERGASRDEPDAPVSFETGEICILTAADTLRMRVELAATEEQRAYGLMERDQLSADAGMLFTFQEVQPAEGGFWMYRTRIPLDIAFIGPAGEIVSIQAMQPCASPEPRWCPTYPAGAPYQAALEANLGFFAARGIRPGARLLRAGQAGCPGR